MNLIDRDKLIETARRNSEIGEIKCTEYDEIYYAAMEAPIVNEWIPASERLPEEPFGCLAIVEDERFDGGGFVPCQSLLPYFIGYDGTSWNDCDGEACDFEVIAWMPIPTYEANND